MPIRNWKMALNRFMIEFEDAWRNTFEPSSYTENFTPSVDGFNHRRLLEPIGNVPPAEFEIMYYRQLEESAMVA